MFSVGINKAQRIYIEKILLLIRIMPISLQTFNILHKWTLSVLSRRLKLMFY